MKFVFEQKHNIAYNTIDKNLNVTLSGFMSYLQETSLKHSEDCGYAIKWYSENLLGFILLNWQVEIYKYPKFSDEIIISTYVTNFKGVLVDRVFKVTDKFNNLILCANSKWIYMDIMKNKPKKINNEIISTFGVIDDLPIEINYDFQKTEDYYPVNCNQLKVTRREIDSNSHVNNLKYIEWTLDLLDDETYYGYNVSKLKIQYKKQCLNNTEVLVEIFKKNEFQYISEIKDSNNMYCIIFFELEKVKD